MVLGSLPVAQRNAGAALLGTVISGTRSGREKKRKAHACDPDAGVCHVAMTWQPEIV